MSAADLRKLAWARGLVLCPYVTLCGPDRYTLVSVVGQVVRGPMSFTEMTAFLTKDAA